jgi:hypothetical protein
MVGSIGRTIFIRRGDIRLLGKIKKGGTEFPDALIEHITVTNCPRSPLETVPIFFCPFSAKIISES